MWILHPKIGFLSVVEKSSDKSKGTLTIRARVNEDLIRLKAYLPDMSDIVTSENTDYRYRSVAKREAVMAAMSKLAADIDYDNFKNEVALRQGYQRAAIYNDVWEVLYGLQT
ncbi:hypothetical protein MCEMIH15_01904 [Caulobacteraceae bacterium]